MEWTPRRIAEVLRLNHRLHTQDLREQLAIMAMAFRGDPKAIQKALKDDP